MYNQTRHKYIFVKNGKQELLFKNLTNTVSSGFDAKHGSKLTALVKEKYLEKWDL